MKIKKIIIKRPSIEKNKFKKIYQRIKWMRRT